VHLLFDNFAFTAFQALVAGLLGELLLLNLMHEKADLFHLCYLCLSYRCSICLNVACIPYLAHSACLSHMSACIRLATAPLKPSDPESTQLMHKGRFLLQLFIGAHPVLPSFFLES
jgi:hypothetical protein